MHLKRNPLKIMCAEEKEKLRKCSRNFTYHITRVLVMLPTRLLYPLLNITNTSISRMHFMFERTGEICFLFHYIRMLAMYTGIILKNNPYVYLTNTLSVSNVIQYNDLILSFNQKLNQTMNTNSHSLINNIDYTSCNLVFKQFCQCVTFN